MDERLAHSAFIGTFNPGKILNLKTRATIAIILGILMLEPGFNLKAQHYAILKVSNDMTYFTDRYFSNGVDLILYLPNTKNIPLRFLLLPNDVHDKVYYGVTFNHNMYTPTDTYTPEINYEDHPYAAYLLVGICKDSYSEQYSTRVSSAFSLGWMGPLAGGQVFQNSMHSVISIAEYVQGWHNQVGNDFCMQYSAIIEKGMIKAPWLELNGILAGRLGSPHTDAKMGSSMRVGWFDSYFRHNGLEARKQLQIYGFCSGDVNFSCYNAALQGGLNNRNNPHTLSQMNPMFWHMAFGGALVYRKFKIELAQEVVSPQFPTMGWHRWAYLMVMVGF